MFDLRAEARKVMPSIERIPELDQIAVATWRGRMVNEYSSSRVFDALARQMRRAGVAEEDVAAVETFAQEERKHGILCGAVVEALGHEARAPFREEGDLPEHEDVAPLEGVLRNLLSISCLSETVAVALIGAERIEMPESPLRELLTEIWADEIGHARFGWSFLTRHAATLDDGAKERLATYLRVAFAHVEVHELAHLPDRDAPGHGGEALGLCSGRDARVLFYETLETVIVPRLEALGIAAANAYAKRSMTLAA